MVIWLLQSTPCIAQTPKIVEDFAAAVTTFKLTKAELLQLINLRPTTPVEIQLIVEECEERITEDQVCKLCNKVQSRFSLSGQD